MKIIISRKGFDSTNGGCPSPIFQDGRALSLPIPVRHAPICFTDIQHDPEPLADIVEHLSRKSISPFAPAHLDPDLKASHLIRNPGWLPAFGQSGAAQSHLASHGVGVGDLFLFFGWFRRVIEFDGKWKYEPGAPHQHVLFGWLQVGEVLRVGQNIDTFKVSHPWLANHPHMHGTPSSLNTIYVAKSSLIVPNLYSMVTGGGTFSTIRSQHVLTADRQSKRSLWHLPECFNPNEKSSFSYHSAPSRWSRSPEGTLQLQSVAIGQEFVLDTADYPGVLDWIPSLFEGEQ